MQNNSLSLDGMAEQPQIQESVSKGSNVKWQDDVESLSATVDEDGFLARQKRRISEHPQINQIQLARKTSKHKISFLRKALMIVASSTIIKTAFYLMRLIPVSKILMSLFFFNECPIETIIVIYLLVGGVLAVVREVVGKIMQNCFNEECLDENEIVLTLVAFLYTVGEFLWFIYGSYFVYKNFTNYPWDEYSGRKYCNNVLYMYSFVVTTLSYVLLLLVFSISCCSVCLAKVTETSPSSTRSSKT